MVLNTVHWFSCNKAIPIAFHEVCVFIQKTKTVSVLSREIIISRSLSQDSLDVFSAQSQIDTRSRNSRIEKPYVRFYKKSNRNVLLIFIAVEIT